MIVSKVLKEITERFKDADIDTPELDAEVILSYIMNTERCRLVVDRERILSESEKREVNRLIEKRIKGEPVAYIICRKEFYSLEFELNHNVFIPRPDTELLVDLAIYYANHGGKVLDLGCGSGAIAIALKYNRSDLDIIASDLSEEALIVAVKNARKILDCDSIKFVLGDIFKPFQGNKFDIIISNPPYINPNERVSLQREILFEPYLSLFANDEGRETICRIVKDAGHYLDKNGILLIEIGSNMSDYIRKLGENNNISFSIINDYRSLPRVAVGKYKK